MSIGILDCTLRDGGYLNEAKFGRETVVKMLKNLADSGIGTIECGFFEQERDYKPEQTYFSSMQQINELLPESNTDFVLFYDPLSPFKKPLEEYSGKGVNGLRVGTYHFILDNGIKGCREIKEKGYNVYFQAVDTLSYPRDDLLRYIEAANELGAKTLAIVDTYGTMTPKDLPPLIEIAEQYLDPGIPLGFHAHNNKQLAFGLSLQFIQQVKRNVVIDTSLCGMGRGAGNTPTELVVNFMNEQMGASYKMEYLLELMDSVMPNIEKNYKWGYSTTHFLAGVYASHVKNLAHLQKKEGVSLIDLANMLSMIDHSHHKRYDYDYLDDIYKQYKNGESGSNG